MFIKIINIFHTYKAAKLCVRPIELPEIDDSNAFEPRSDRRDLLTIKVKSEIFTEKERPSIAVVNNYRKIEEIIFTNNKDMSI